VSINLEDLENRVLERLRERFDLPDDAEVIVAESDNGDDDWELPVHVTVLLPDGEDAYGLADLGSGDALDDVVDYLLDQVQEGLPPQWIRDVQ
jgi:hypothetical protein